MTNPEIENMFTYHAPFGNQATRYQEIRDAAKAFAYLIQRHCPDSREKSLAFTSLQQTVMWANASVAIHE